MQPRPLGFERLPKKWQQYINDLERHAATQEKVLREFCDQQTKSNVSYDAIVGGEEFSKTCYVQTDRVTFHLGERKSISARLDDKGGIYLMGSDQLSFRAESSNTTSVYLVKD